MLNRFRIVLVNTSHPGNIGATARAMKNMGLGRLYLANPQRFPDPEAEWRASGATDVLDNAVVVDSLQSAIADCGLVVATSARDRRIPWPVINPREFAEQSFRELNAEKHQSEVAIVFGREDRGLTNEELQLCHAHVHIPTNSDYSSLNIAMAVQVICYELRLAWLASNGDVLDDQVVQVKTESPSLPVFSWNNDWDSELATTEEMHLFFDHLQQTLVDIEFLNPKNPRQLMTRLRRLFYRCRLDKMEVNILRGILTAVDKKGG